MSTPVSLDLPPGVVKTQSALAAKGRYIDCDGVRFWQGKPEKLGGQLALTSIPVIGAPRGMCAWSDLAGRQIIGLGTPVKLYAIPNDSFVPLDITPLIQSVALIDPFTTTAGSNVVTVAWPGQIGSAGSYVDFSGASAVGGLTLNGTFPINTVVSGGVITIIAPAPAASSATGGGAVSAGNELSAGVVDPTIGYGWGAGAWGVGTWGTPRATSSIVFTPRYWSLDYFGKILLACPMGGSIYSWDPTVYPTPRAAIVPNAPTTATGIVRTGDYIVIAYGTNYGGVQNYMQWWACAQGDYTNWDVTQFAGPQGSPSVTGVLSEGTEIVAASDLGVHITLVWTDTSVYAFQFTGSQFVFDISRVGKECGLLGPLAKVIVDTVAFWAGNSGFYMYNGSVSPIPNQNDILDWVFSQIPMNYGIKTVANYNEKYKEVRFEFVVTGGTEPTIAVVFNIEGQFWYTSYSIPYSSSTRFTGADSRPIIAKTDGFIYQMDNGLDVVAPGGTEPQNWYLLTAPMEIQLGVQSYGTEYIAIDMERQVGTITVTISAYDRTPAAATVIDSQTVTFDPADGTTDVRVCGRQLQARYSSSGLGCDFRMGVLKAAVQPNGARN